MNKGKLMFGYSPSLRVPHSQDDAMVNSEQKFEQFALLSAGAGRKES